MTDQPPMFYVKDTAPPENAEWCAMSDILKETEQTGVHPAEIIKREGWNFYWGTLWRAAAK